MRSAFAAVVGLQALVASAMPGVLEARQRCNADNCLRALRASTNSAKATSDCRAYFGEQIVTPCPVTVTSGTATSITFVPSTTTVITNTVTSTALETSTSLSTITTTITANMDKRQVEVCPATNTKTGSIPAYASTCTSGTRFSSACSCIGISTGFTTTLAAATVTSASATVTSTNTVVMTSYEASTLTVTSTVVITSVLTSTVSTTSSSSSSSSSSTSGTTSSSTTTSSPAPPSCPTFAITYEGTNPAGTGKNFNRDFTTGTVTLGNASPLWYLQDNGKLTPLENQGQGIVLSQFESSGQPFDRMNVDSDPQPKNLQCSVDGGILTCEGSNGTEPDASDEFYICPDYTASQSYASGPGTLYISDGTNLPDGCTQIFLTATAQC